MIILLIYESDLFLLLSNFTIACCDPSLHSPQVTEPESSQNSTQSTQSFGALYQENCILSEIFVSLLLSKHLGTQTFGDLLDLKNEH